MLKFTTWNGGTQKRANQLLCFCTGWHKMHTGDTFFELKTAQFNLKPLIQYFLAKQ